MWLETLSKFCRGHDLAANENWDEMDAWVHRKLKTMKGNIAKYMNPRAFITSCRIQNLKILQFPNFNLYKNKQIR